MREFACGYASSLIGALLCQPSLQSQWRDEKSLYLSQGSSECLLGNDHIIYYQVCSDGGGRVGNDFFNGPSADTEPGKSRWGRGGRKWEHWKEFAVLLKGDA